MVSRMHVVRQMQVSALLCLGACQVRLRRSIWPLGAFLEPSAALMLGFSIGALIIIIGFWGPLFYNYNKEPPK